jgi:hypothetical protein
MLQVTKTLNGSRLPVEEAAWLHQFLTQIVAKVMSMPGIYLAPLKPVMTYLDESIARHD